MGRAWVAPTCFPISELSSRTAFRPRGIWCFRRSSFPGKQQQIPRFARIDNFRSTVSSRLPATLHADRKRFGAVFFAALAHQAVEAALEQ
jgi:hypothetical protein